MVFRIGLQDEPKIDETTMEPAKPPSVQKAKIGDADLADLPNLLNWLSKSQPMEISISSISLPHQLALCSLLEFTTQRLNPSTLRMSQVPLTAPVLAALSHLMSKAPLNQLSLTKASLDDDGLSLLARFVPAGLRYLDLSNNHLSSSSATALSLILSACPLLSELSLSNNPLGRSARSLLTHGHPSMADFSRDPSTPQPSNPSSLANGKKDPSTSHPFSLVKSKTDLLSSDHSSLANGKGDPSAPHLSDSSSLANGKRDTSTPHPSDKDLDFSSLISNALTKATRLRSLGLMGCELNSSAVTRLAGVARDNRALAFLDLRANPGLNRRLSIKIVEALKRNSRPSRPPCPNCKALELRIASLEAELSALKALKARPASHELELLCEAGEGELNREVTLEAEPLLTASLSAVFNNTLEGKAGEPVPGFIEQRANLSAIEKPRANQGALAALIDTLDKESFCGNELLKGLDDDDQRNSSFEAE